MSTRSCSPKGHARTPPSNSPRKEGVLAAKFSDARFLRAFHGWATITWAVLIVPSVLWWRSSLPWIVLMSVWANLAGHWSSWQASRVEVKEDERDAGSQP